MDSTLVNNDEGIIDQLDTCLSRYYSKNGKNNYFNKNNIGKFREYCDENGFDDDFVEEEIRENYEDCQLLDFDEYFPFIEENIINKSKEIYRILQKCFLNKNAFKDNLLMFKPSLDISLTHWESVNNTEIEETKRIYSKTLSTIWNTEMETDINILKVITIGRIRHIPYLQYLTDMYLRDRIIYKQLNVTKWSLKNKYMLNLLNNNKLGNKIIFETAKAAIDSFFHRICPILMFQSQTKIQDSLLRISNYILLIVKFIYNLSKDNNQSCPFQSDHCIMFDKVISNQQMNTKGIFNFEDDSDSDSDDDIPYNDDLNFTDEIGDIKKKLDYNKLLYYESINLFKSRFAHEFNKFKNTIISKKYKGIQFMQYPRNKRFITVIDRRKTEENGNEKKQEDKVIFFEPPNNCNTLPNINIPEWYFDSSRTCIIPNIDTNDYKNNNMNRQTTITSLNSCKGAIIVLSFHVLSCDEVKCYLYLNGTVTRFFPSDLINILPLYFDLDLYKNKHFIQSQQLKDIIQEMTPKLRDYRFESFYDQYKCK